jgi:hypothetical protein
MKKKCNKCGKVKSLKDFQKVKRNKDGHHSRCKKCTNEWRTKYRNTENGFLRMRYDAILTRCSLDNRKCHFSCNEFITAFEKHKSIYGMKSAWGPGPDQLDQHLPITMIHDGNGQVGESGVSKGAKRIVSNLSIDRLDSNRDYTLQNLIFIRFDENARKHRSSYEDCKIQVRLHEERFMKEKKFISRDITSLKT